MLSLLFLLPLGTHRALSLEWVVKGIWGWAFNWGGESGGGP